MGFELGIRENPFTDIMHRLGTTSLLLRRLLLTHAYGVHFLQMPADYNYKLMEEIARVLVTS